MELDLNTYPRNDQLYLPSKLDYEALLPPVISRAYMDYASEKLVLTYFLRRCKTSWQLLVGGDAYRWYLNTEYENLTGWWRMQA
ncbi:unnamed protein product [Ilex paraguariensis]|uniref:Uncharacterized protein n=1 Tax=Ilex paraguariensis TaxID=185542 RepID=A0ABC8STT1_9AQUA